MDLANMQFRDFAPADPPSNAHSRHRMGPADHNWDARWSHQVPHDRKYYAKCLLGGALSSSIRWLLTPLDRVKTNMQVNPVKFPSFYAGMKVSWAEGGLAVLYRGLGVTIMTYSVQCGTKYFLYEVLKDRISTAVGKENATRHCGWIYVAAAASAEACADVLMCPWEMIKVKVQTSAPGTFPTKLGPSVATMIRYRDTLRFPFGSLGPLIARQVPGTIVNFYTFERVVEGVYTYLLTAPRETYSKPTQLGVTFASGYLSGIVCTAITHPADSLISLMAKPEHQGKPMHQIAREVGLCRLATKGLGPRMCITGAAIGFQWWIYDSFKTVMGMGTSGGKQ
jgi:solute carrier family 25 (mitochondrial phosphate transporter), member 3